MPSAIRTERPAQVRFDQTEPDDQPVAGGSSCVMRLLIIGKTSDESDSNALHTHSPGRRSHRGVPPPNKPSAPEDWDANVHETKMESPSDRGRRSLSPDKGRHSVTMKATTGFRASRRCRPTAPSAVTAGPPSRSTAGTYGATYPGGAERCRARPPVGQYVIALRRMIPNTDTRSPTHSVPIGFFRGRLSCGEYCRIEGSPDDSRRPGCRAPGD